ncbi:MAG: penicillin acylase family protein [Bacteroidia bacterium]|nr:penicillin acylase family protein [Bacteroidia bacterium]
MKRRHTSIALTVSTILLLIFAGYLTYDLATRALPETQGEASVSALSGPVEVFRDQAGIPHILAGNEYDAFVAAGYVHAQDRLWQMDVLRRYGSGRLAEIFGAEALPADRLMRTIGLHRQADSLLTEVSDQTRKILDAYSKGVNAGIHERGHSLPIEFDLLQYQPEPWTPAHSLIIARLLGWELALSWWTDLTLSELIARFGEERARQLFPPQQTAISSLPHPTQPRQLVSLGLLHDGAATAQRLLASQGSAIGSNAWAVTGTRSVNGKPLLANDPHLLISQPSRWYIMHLSAPGLNVGGVTIPGVPGIVIGHNSVLTWGMTNLMADDVDFFTERVNYRDSTCIDAGRSVGMRVFTDSIFVRDSLPVVQTTWQTPRGPIITPVYPLQNVIRDSSRFSGPTAVSLRWAGQEASDEILAMYRAAHARNWNEFQSSFATFGVPAQHIIYADTSGVIARLAVGRVPIRGKGQALLPSAGWEGANSWQGYVPAGQLPRLAEPEEGMLVAANNKVPTSSPVPISSLWEDDSRAKRIHQMLSEQAMFTPDDFRLMQMDVQSPYADTLRRAFVGALRAWKARPLLITRVMNLLARWDCRMNTSSAEAAIFNAALTHVLRRTFEDEMDSTLFHNYTFVANIVTRVLPTLLADSTETWFDDIRTPGRESKRHILVKGITDAVTDLRTALGRDMNTWNWGRLHTIEFRHPFGEKKPLDRLFNIGPFSIGGSNTTVNNTEYSISRPYDARVAASMRFVADLNSPDSSYIVIPGGQSGQPFSPHYADHTAFWHMGALHRLVINVEAVRRSGWKRLSLTN